MTCIPEKIIPEINRRAEEVGIESVDDYIQASSPVCFIFTQHHPLQGGKPTYSPTMVSANLPSTRNRWEMLRGSHGNLFDQT